MHDRDVSDSSVWLHRSGGADDAYLRGRERAENFPVALRVLPREPRAHLSAIYDVVRVIDDLGDEAPADRTALLAAFRADLETIWDGARPHSPVLQRLVPTVAATGLTPGPFRDLVQANLVDQVRTRYATYDDLAGYCALSANPVGRLVLAVFGADTPDNAALSDRVCTALQIVEHCQDVAEDRRAGRCYLPREDLDRYGVREGDLDTAPASPALRRLIAFEAGRAGRLLDAGTPLAGRLSGWARLAVTGYVAGGRAAIAALRREKWDVMSTSPRVRRLNVVQQMVAMYAGGRRAG